MASVTFLLIGQICYLTLISSSEVPTLSASLGRMASHHRVKRQTVKVNTAITGFSDEEKTNILNKHNELRKIPDAANMCAMVWDDTLATKAQGWANTCRFDHNPDTSIAGSSDTAGENLHAVSGGYNEVAAIQTLYDEVNDYMYLINACAPNKECGHYTQIVWATSSRVGCGIKFCPTAESLNFNNAYITVCNYAPAGNLIGQKPYVQGAACSQCTAEKPQCIDGLCSDEPTTTESPSTSTSTEPTSTTMESTSTMTETTPTATTSMPTTSESTSASTMTDTTPTETTSMPTTSESTSASTMTDTTPTATTSMPTTSESTSASTMTDTTPTETTSMPTTSESTSASTMTDTTPTETTSMPTTSESTSASTMTDTTPTETTSMPTTSESTSASTMTDTTPTETTSMPTTSESTSASTMTDTTPTATTSMPTTSESTSASTMTDTTPTETTSMPTTSETAPSPMVITTAGSDGLISSLLGITLAVITPFI